MDSLANYASDGENSNNSEDAKMPYEAQNDARNRRASDANYDPVQMDMSEESNNNNSSRESSSERTDSPAQTTNSSKTETSRTIPSPSEQRRNDHENHTTNSKEDQKRSNDRWSDRNRHSSEKSRRSSYDDRKSRDNSHRDSGSRDSKSRRDDERRREKGSSKEDSSRRSEDREKSEKDKDHHHRDERRERNRDRSERDKRQERDRDRDRERERERERDRERARDRRHGRDERSKDRHSRTDDRTTYHKEKDRGARSRSRSRDRAVPPFRAMSYREEKGRNKLAQLEKLGIELKAPEGDAPAKPGVQTEQNYYNPLATATQGKYAEQIQKRKLLWANKSKQEDGKGASAASTANTWVGTTFTHDQDGKLTAKFKRLMGIKDDASSGGTGAVTGSKPDILKKQEEMFNNMEQQYEVARATTHTQRGVGLGYATGGYQFPR